MQITIAVPSRTPLPCHASDNIPLARRRINTLLAFKITVKDEN